MTMPRSLIAIASVFALGCSGAYEGESISVTAPSETTFAPVARALDYSCGSLDCHGAIGRNLRLYGNNGRRLDPNDVPCGTGTTPAEVLADYRSAIALEPELLSQIVETNGEPSRLTLVRKASGEESHKGGAVYPKGTQGYDCLTHWIEGADVTSCNNVIPRVPVVTCTP